MNSPLLTRRKRVKRDQEVQTGMSVILLAHCELCSTDISDSPLQFAVCSHRYCQECFRAYLEKAVSSLSKKPRQQKFIRCPVLGCSLKLNLVEVVRSLLWAPRERVPTQVSESEIEIQEKKENPNHGCKRCHKQAAYMCGQCMVEELEECAKINFYSKQQRLEDLLSLDVGSDKYKKFISDLEQRELICPVCRDFNQFPMIACVKGHEICRDCLYSITQRDINQICPLCKAELLPVPAEALRAKNLIQNIQIECPTCELKIPYTEFITFHFRQCIESKVECQYCKQKVEQHFYEIHIANYCPERNCPFVCDKMINQHENMVMEHLIAAFKKSDIAYTFNLRMNVIERYGSVNVCSQCECQLAWKLDNGCNEAFCFKCFKLTG